MCGVHIALGHVAKAGAWESRGPSKRELPCLGGSVSNPLTLAVATPIVTSDPFPGVSDNQVPSLFHRDLTGHASTFPLSSLFPCHLQGIALGSVKLLFSGKAALKTCLYNVASLCSSPVICTWVCYDGITDTKKHQTI